MLAGRRQLSLEETGRRRLRRQSSEIRPILAWQESFKESAEKQQSQVQVVAKKIGQPKPTPPRPIRSPSVRNDSCLNISRRQVAERLKLGWNKAIAKEGQDKGRQNLNIFLNKSFEARSESPGEEDFKNGLRRSQSVYNTNEEDYNSDSSSESESDDDPPTERLNEPAPRAVSAQPNIQSTQSQTQQPFQQQQVQQYQQKTQQQPQLQIQQQQQKTQQQTQLQIQQQQQKAQQQQQQQNQQQRLSASARRAVFKAAGRQRPTTCSPEPRPRLMSAPPQPARPPPAERSRSAPPRRRQQRKPRRGVEGGEVVTMVSLVSPAESEEEEDLYRPVHCPPTPEVTAPPSPPPTAPPVLSLRRPLKAGD
ncbi:unnamed protein product [Nezara viridula]|uniref:Uncharacterized protein n=1 Tax=Nezara viridula TaxID=85310 RepID=A0A9P0E825_NEZVI|nr:unnamed protein product [Nezara viridula]